MCLPQCEIYAGTWMCMPQCEIYAGTWMCMPQCEIYAGTWMCMPQCEIYAGTYMCMTQCKMLCIYQCVNVRERGLTIKNRLTNSFHKTTYWVNLSVLLL